MFNLKSMTMALAMFLSIASWAEQIEQVKELKPPQAQLESDITQSPDTININTADAKQLSKLSNIGLKKANQIIEYRKLHGEFSSIDELKKVKGIGKSTIEKNRLRMVASAP